MNVDRSDRARIDDQGFENGLATIESTPFERFHNLGLRCVKTLPQVRVQESKRAKHSAYLDALDTAGRVQPADFHAKTDRLQEKSR